MLGLTPSEVLMRALCFAPILLAALGCSATNAQSTFSGDGTTSTTGGSGGGDVITGSGGGGAGAGGGLGTGGGGGGPPIVDCSKAAELVYVLSEDDELYSFSPPDKAFKKIGKLPCSAAGMSPNSMAIDRDANAWVNYVKTNGVNDVGGALFKVSMADDKLACEPAKVPLDEGWYRVGMGFSLDAVGAKTETLYITSTGDPFGVTSLGLGKVDLAAQMASKVGNFTGDLAGKNAELTGTGDARLFGFFTTTPVVVAEIDKATATITSQKELADVSAPAAWAFSFWGGDFYLYTAPATATESSKVTRYRPSDGSVGTYIAAADVGFRIVGAGVSTCAPIAPPK
jgi:hypothetical protein